MGYTQSFPWLLYRSSALVAEEKSIVIAADVQFSDCGVVIKDKDRNGINMKRINGEFSLSLASEGKLQHGLFSGKKLSYWCLKYPLANEIWGKYPSKLEYFFADLAETRITSSGDFSLFKDHCDKKEPMEKSDHEGSCEPDLKRAKPFDV